MDRAAVKWTDSVGQTFSNVSDVFSSARAPASMAHCRAAFKPDILVLPPRIDEKSLFVLAEPGNVASPDGACAAPTDRD
jgi:hypothetical protein